MNAPKSGIAEILRFALIEVVVVLIGIEFVRREVYLGGHFGEMVLHWQEYAVLALAFVDGLVRGQTRALYSSPFRKRILRYFLPFALFLYVACSSLCDKLNVACIRAEWFRDIGLCIMGGGIVFLIIAQRTRPKAFQLSGVARSKPENLAEPESSNASLEQENDPTKLESEAAKPELEAEKSEREAGKPASEAPKSESETAKPGMALPDNSEEPARPADLLNPAEPDPEPLNASEIRGPWRYLRYPTRTAILLELVGLSMALAAWMPVFTLPGLIILFKWELSDLEAFRISQLGDEYVKYKNSSWYLVPFVY